MTKASLDGSPRSPPIPRAVYELRQNAMETNPALAGFFLFRKTRRPAVPQRPDPPLCLSGLFVAAPLRNLASLQFHLPNFGVEQGWAPTHNTHSCDCVRLQLLQSDCPAWCGYGERRRAVARCGGVALTDAGGVSSIDAVNLEDVLGEINSDRTNLHLDGPFM